MFFLSSKIRHYIEMRVLSHVLCERNNYIKWTAIKSVSARDTIITIFI